MEASAQEEEEIRQMKDKLRKPDHETADTESGNDQILNLNF